MMQTDEKKRLYSAFCWCFLSLADNKGILPAREPRAVVGHSQHIMQVTVLGSAYLLTESPPQNAAAATRTKKMQTQHSNVKSTLLAK